MKFRGTKRKSGGAFCAVGAHDPIQLYGDTAWGFCCRRRPLQPPLLPDCCRPGRMPLATPRLRPHSVVGSLARFLVLVARAVGQSSTCPGSPPPPLTAASLRHGGVCPASELSCPRCPFERPITCPQVCHLPLRTGVGPPTTLRPRPCVPASAHPRVCVPASAHPRVCLPPAVSMCTGPVRCGRAGLPPERVHPRRVQRHGL